MEPSGRDPEIDLLAMGKRNDVLDAGKTWGEQSGKSVVKIANHSRARRTSLASSIASKASVENNDVLVSSPASNQGGEKIG